MSHYQRLTEILKRFMSNNEAGVRELLADDLVFIVPGTSNMPWSHCSPDADGFLDFLRISLAAMTSKKFKILWHIENDELCIARSQEKICVNETGVVVDIAMIWETHWKDGKLTYFHEFYDTKKLDNAFIGTE